MRVKRIVANISGQTLKDAESFYGKIFGLELLMDHGWIVTYGSQQTMSIQLSIATQGGSGTLVPDLSIEVDDVDEALARITEAGFAIEYGPADEPWGVRRFYVRDPFGKLINVLSHTGPSATTSS
jgi:catechol 2,3-dioxygenase-like lactoylglutathione lyase family enzyme